MAAVWSLKYLAILSAESPGDGGAPGMNEPTTASTTKAKPPSAAIRSHLASSMVAPSDVVMTDDVQHPTTRVAGGGWLSEPARDVVVGARVVGRGEDALRAVDLDQHARAAAGGLVHLGGEEGGAIGDSGGLLHVVGDDHD